MDFAVDAPLPFERALVFRTLRDEMSALAAYLPDIASISCTARSEQGEWILTAWQTEARTKLPRALREVLGDALFRWTDHARWSETQWLCDWHTESDALRGAIRCQARDTFEDAGAGRCWVRIRGALHVDAQKLALAGPLRTLIAAQLESYLARKLERDVLVTLGALERSLDEAGRPRAD